MKLYVVVGHTGIGNDSYDWLVKAFKDEKEANAFSDSCEAIADGLLAKYEHYSKIPMSSTVHPLDPNFFMRLGGTYYEIEEVKYEE